jgi:hypothetical protein
MVTHGTLIVFSQLRALAALANGKAQLPGKPFRFLPPIYFVTNEATMLNTWQANNGEYPGGYVCQTNTPGFFGRAYQLIAEDYKQLASWQVDPGGMVVSNTLARLNTSSPDVGTVGLVTSDQSVYIRRPRITGGNPVWEKYNGLKSELERLRNAIAKTFLFRGAERWEENRDLGTIAYITNLTNLSETAVSRYFGAWHIYGFTGWDSGSLEPEDNSTMIKNWRYLWADDGTPTKLLCAIEAGVFIPYLGGSGYPIEYTDLTDIRTFYEGNLVLQTLKVTKVGFKFRLKSKIKGRIIGRINFRYSRNSGIAPQFTLGGDTSIITGQTAFPASNSDPRVEVRIEIPNVNDGTWEITMTQTSNFDSVTLLSPYLGSAQDEPNRNGIAHFRFEFEVTDKAPASGIHRSLPISSLTLPELNDVPPKMYCWTQVGASLNSRAPTPRWFQMGQMRVSVSGKTDGCVLFRPSMLQGQSMETKAIWDHEQRRTLHFEADRSKRFDDPALTGVLAQVNPALDYRLPAIYVRRSTDSPNLIKLTPLPIYPNGGTVPEFMTVRRVRVRRVLTTTNGVRPAGELPALPVKLGCIRNGAFSSFVTLTIPANQMEAQAEASWPDFTQDSLAYECAERVYVDADVIMPNTLTEGTAVTYPILAAHYNDTEGALTGLS